MGIGAVTSSLAHSTIGISRPSGSGFIPSGFRPIDSGFRLYFNLAVERERARGRGRERVGGWGSGGVGGGREIERERAIYREQSPRPRILPSVSRSGSGFRVEGSGWGCGGVHARGDNLCRLMQDPLTSQEGTPHNVSRTFT